MWYIIAWAIDLWTCAFLFWRLLHDIRPMIMLVFDGVKNSASNQRCRTKCMPYSMRVGLGTGSKKPKKSTLEPWCDYYARIIFRNYGSKREQAHRYHCHQFVQLRAKVLVETMSHHDCSERSSDWWRSLPLCATEQFWLLSGRQHQLYWDWSGLKNFTETGWKRSKAEVATKYISNIHASM